MALTAEQIATAQEYLGTAFNEDDLEERLLRTESLYGAIREVLRIRIADLAGGGALSFSIPGEYSENRTENLAALQRLLSAVNPLADTEEGTSDPSIIELVRRDPTRPISRGR